MRHCITNNQRQVRRREEGFSIVELMVVMGLFVVLSALMVAGLARPQTTASLGASVNTIVADLRSQQLHAMSGNTGTDSIKDPHGIFLQANGYTLFKGNSYVAGNSQNFVVNLGNEISVSSSFVGSTILFDKGTGEINGFNPALANNIILTNTNSGQTTTLVLNRLGVVTIN